MQYTVRQHLKLAIERYATIYVYDKAASAILKKARLSQKINNYSYSKNMFTIYSSNDSTFYAERNCMYCHFLHSFRNDKQQTVDACSRALAYVLRA